MITTGSTPYKNIPADKVFTPYRLSDLSQLNPRDLGYSGRKRVALAAALAMQTPVLVFDEPTAGLDAREQGQLSQVIT